MAAVVLALGVGCGGEDIRSGIVVDKKYEPEREYSELQPVFVPSPNGPVIGYYIPQTRIDDEDFLLQLWNQQLDRKGWIEVPKEEYERYNKGDMYP